MITYAARINKKTGKGEIKITLAAEVLTDARFKALVEEVKKGAVKGMSRFHFPVSKYSEDD